MTTKPTTTHAFLPLPDPPEREPDDMTSVQHLGENGNLHHLLQYLGNPETTIVSGERYIVPVRERRPTSESRPTCSSHSTRTRRYTGRTTATSYPGRASLRTW